MEKEIMKKYNEIRTMIFDNYDKIKIVDNYDCNSEIPYTIFYLNKQESFDKFKDAWQENINYMKELDDYSYDNILNRFSDKNNDFDYVELGTLDIYTDKEYELEI